MLGFDVLCWVKVKEMRTFDKTAKAKKTLAYNQDVQAGKAPTKAEDSAKVTFQAAEANNMNETLEERIARKQRELREGGKKGGKSPGKYVPKKAPKQKPDAGKPQVLDYSGSNQEEEQAIGPGTVIENGMNLCPAPVAPLALH